MEKLKIQMLAGNTYSLNSNFNARSTDENSTLDN